MVDGRDATYVKVHPHAAGAVGGNQGMGRTKGGLNTKAHLAVDAHGLPLGVTVTEGAVDDCKEFGNLLDEVDQKSEHVIADKNYDSDELINDVEERGAKPFIPPNQTEKIRGVYDKHLYQVRRLVENAFLKLKRWRSIATRYGKRESSFLAIVHIGCMLQWLRIS